MKTTVEIPDQELEDLMKFTRAKTKSEAVNIAIVDFNRRMRMAKLIRYIGTCDDLISPTELQAQRRVGFSSWQTDKRSGLNSRDEKQFA